MLWRDRVALKDMSNAVVNGGIRPDPFGKKLWLTVCVGDHFAKAAFLKKADLAKLLFPHLFIRCALQFLGPGLVDDVGALLFGQLATKPFLLTLDRHVPLLRPLREPLDQPGIDAFNLKS